MGMYKGDIVSNMGELRPLDISKMDRPIIHILTKKRLEQRYFDHLLDGMAIEPENRIFIDPTTTSKDDFTIEYPPAHMRTFVQQQKLRREKERRAGIELKTIMFVDRMMYMLTPEDVSKCYVREINGYGRCIYMGLIAEMLAFDEVPPAFRRNCEYIFIFGNNDDEGDESDLKALFDSYIVGHQKLPYTTFKNLVSQCRSAGEHACLVWDCITHELFAYEFPTC